MGSLDQISQAIGSLQSDVRNILEKVKNTHECLHAGDGVVSRVTKLERDSVFGKGKAAGIGAVAGATGGAAITAFWKTIAAKIGLSL